MNIPQEEDKRYQGKSETEKGLPSNNALNFAPPFSKAQNENSRSLQASGAIDAQNHIEDIAGLFPNARRSGSGWKIPCPVHKGEDPNCYLAVGDDGGFVAKCHSKGCKWADIMDALGLPKRGYGRHYVASYGHPDGQDRHVYRRDIGNGKKKIWGKGKADGCRLLPWGEDAPEKTVVLVEGEKAAEAFQRAGIDGYIAVTWRNGAKSVDRANFSLCKGRKVLLWPDNDGEGLTAMQTAGNMSAAAGAAEVRMLAVDDLPEKGDAANLKPDAIKERLTQLTDWEPDAPEVATTLPMKTPARDEVLRKAAATVEKEGRFMALYDRLWRYDGAWQEVDEYLVRQALQDAAVATHCVTMHSPVEREALLRFEWLTRPRADKQGMIRREDRWRNVRLDTGKPLNGTVFDDEVVWIEGDQLMRRPVEKEDFVISRKPFRLPEIGASESWLNQAKEFWRFLNVSFGKLEAEKWLLLEFGGRVLMQYTSDQKMLVLKGPGRSGKGTYIRLLQNLVGPEQFTAYSKLSELGGRFQTARMTGKSLATIGDLAEQPRGRDRRDAFLEGAAVVKAITGEDAVTIEEKRKNAFAALLPVSFVAATNHPPQFLTSGADAGAWKERMLICRFPHEIKADKRIEGLDAALYAKEGPDIAAVLVYHFLQTRKRGYTLPASHVEEMAALIADATTVAERFVSEQVAFVQGQRLEKGALTERLFAWAEAEGVKVSNADRNAVYRELRARGCHESKGGGKANVPAYFAGVSLRE
ncbi:MAG: DUF5906 domain-containing protein [Caldilineaceae bacterium]|nr:DUF5906 domain-containing protein [Caldilineaceae bacterium]